MFPAKSWA